MKKTLLFTLILVFGFSSLSNAQTALEFDRVNDYVSTTNSLSLTNYTVEVWINWDGTSDPGQNNSIISGSSTNEHILWLIAGKVRVGNSGNEIVVSDGTAVTPGVWTHYAATYDGTTGLMLLYRNGISVGSIASTSGTGFTLSEVNFGRYNVPASKEHLFGGMIDDVRIWDNVRSQADIQANMNTCLTGSETGLAAFYNFEDGTSSTTLADVTGNGNDGTLVNMDPATDWVTGQGSCNTLSVTDEFSVSNVLKVFPNPASDIINIDSTFSIDSIELFNILGKRVLNTQATEKVSISHLSRGVYILKVNSSEGNLTKKVIIE